MRLSRWRLVSLVVASVVVLGAGGFLAFRRITGRHTVPGTDEARAFALSDDRGYVIVETGVEGHFEYEVRAIDLTRGEYARIAAGDGDAEAIAADHEWVLWSVCAGGGRCNGRTLALSLEGGAPRVVVNELAIRIAVSKDRAYLVLDDRRLKVVHLDEKTEPRSLAIDVFDVATDDRYVYVLTPNVLQRLPLAGGNPQVLARGLREASSMSLGHDGAYVACQNSSRDDGEVTYVPFDGSPPVILARSLRRPDRPVAWGSSIAFVHAVPDAHDNSRAVLTLTLVPRGGGDLRTLRDRFGGELVSDGTRLFVMQYDQVIRFPSE